MADQIIWLEAPPPEMEVIESIDTVARWVMEVGTWVNDQEFLPEIRRSSATIQTGHHDFSRIRRKQTDPPSLMVKDEVAGSMQSGSIKLPDLLTGARQLHNESKKAERHPEQI